VIAHRGASGYLPEHTLEAKALAHAQGADYIEQDVVATRDGELIVLHDLYLESVTDVADQYPHRRRADGHYYAIDFELADLRHVTVTERKCRDGSAPCYPGRLQADSGGFRIATLNEEIQLIQELNRTSNREVGIYAEIKHPTWHAQHGIDLSKLLLERLSHFGYASAEDSAFLQCFDATELRRLREELGTRLKLVQLVNEAPAYDELLTPAGLARLGQHAEVVSPAYRQLVTATANQAAITPSSLAQQIREAGLLMHPHTFRREGLPAYAPTLESLLSIFLHDIRVDGVFCDYPDVAVRVRDSLGME